MSAAAGGTGGEGYDMWSLPTPRSYSVGLSVTFGSNDEAPKPVYQNTTALNDQINDLRAQLANAENNYNSRLAQLQGDLDNATRALANCKNDLAAAKNIAPKIVDNSKQYMNILVHYPVNKTAIGADQRPNVERIASYIHEEPSRGNLRHQGLCFARGQSGEQHQAR